MNGNENEVLHFFTWFYRHYHRTCCYKLNNTQICVIAPGVLTDRIVSVDEGCWVTLTIQF